MIRKGNWKLIEGRGSGGFTEPQVIKPETGAPAGQLYNLATDSSERQDLCYKHPEKVKELTLLDQLRQGKTK